MGRAEELKNKLLGITFNKPCSLAICEEEEMRGCDESEIAEIQAVVGFPLPEAYKTFLRIMGRGLAFSWESMRTRFFCPEVTSPR